jgi:hypothetical protein
MGYTTCFDPDGVSSYTLLIAELQTEMPIFLLTYTGHKVATLMFIYILFRDADSLNIKLRNFFG